MMFAYLYLFSQCTILHFYQLFIKFIEGPTIIYILLLFNLKNIPVNRKNVFVLFLKSGHSELVYNYYGISIKAGSFCFYSDHSVQFFKILRHKNIYFCHTCTQHHKHKNKYHIFPFFEHECSVQYIQ